MGYTDVDNVDDTWTAVTTETASTNGYGTFTATTAGEWTYTLDNTNEAVNALNDGGTLTDSFVVTAADGTTETVTIDITGTNDAPTFTGKSSGSVDEDADVATATGNLGYTDVDNVDDTWTAVTTETASTNGYGTFTATTAGEWTYTLDNTNEAVNALNDGGTLTDSFVVTAADGTTETVTIDITGTNDAPTFTGKSSGSVDEDADVATATGNLGYTDVDNVDDTWTAVTTETASTNGYGTFTATTAGEWTYTLDNTNEAVNALNDGGTLTDSFVVTAADGTTETVTIDITGTNDAPTFTGKSSGSVDEDADVATATGNLGYTDVDNVDDTWTAVTTETASTNGYGTFTATTAGEWTYTLDNTNEAVNALNDGGTLTDSFVVTAADGTTETVTIDITGTNDAPTFTGKSSGSVDEDADVATATGNLGYTDVDNVDDTWTAVTTETASTNGYGTFTATTAGEWTYTLDNTNEAVNALNDGGTLTDSFVVTAADGTTETVTIDITGTNDAPTFTGKSSGSVDEDADVATATGNLGYTDVDNVDDTWTAVTTETASTNGYGTFTATTAGEWTYTLDNTNEAVNALNDGGTLTDSFVVTAADGTTETVTIDITGTNDAPTFTGKSSGSVDEDADVATATGNLGYTDVDNVDDTWTAVTTETASTNGYGTFTATTAGEWTYTLDNTNEAVNALNDGGTLTDSFVVTAADGTTETVTIDITGTNDAPTFTGKSSGSVDEDADVATATGNLGYTDVDNVDDTWTAVTTETASTNGYGTFTATTAGEWTYTLDNTNEAVNALNDGGTLTDSFVVTAADGTTETVTIDITGTNDAPTFTGKSSGSVDEDADVATATGNLGYTDVDNVDDTWTAVTTETASTNGYGTFTATTAGEWTYTLDNTNEAVNALNDGGTLTDSFVVTAADGTTETVTIDIIKDCRYHD